MNLLNNLPDDELKIRCFLYLLYSEKQLLNVFLE